MANVFPLDRDFQVLPAQSGNIGVLGPAGTAGRVGTWVLHFVPSFDFIGGFAVLGGVITERAKTNNTGMVSIPWRRVTINGVASDYVIVNANTEPGLNPLAGPAIIQVSGNLSVGLLIACDAGNCWIYQNRLQGSPTI